MSVCLSVCLSTVLYFHDGSAVLQPHKTPNSHAAPVFGLALRLGHEEEAEWSLKRRIYMCVCVCVCERERERGMEMRV